MSQITLRGLDQELEKKIRRKARQNRRSLNRVILDMLYQCTGIEEKAKKGSEESLRKLAGTWTEKDADEFLDSIKSCQKIDKDLWS